MFETKLLELDKILEKISAFACIDETKKNILNITPVNDKESISNSLDLTYEAKNACLRLGLIELVNYDLTYTIDRIRINSSLNQNEFREIKSLIYNTNKFICSVMNNLSYNCL